MPDFNSSGFLAPQTTPGDGRGVFLVDSIRVAANPTANDRLIFRIPAGLEVTQVQVQCDDLDTNASPTFAFSVGYAPIEGGSVIAAPTYFAPTGQTTARTGGRLICAFKPITFQEDVALTITVGTAAATFAAGDIHVILAGAHKGVR